MFRIKICGITNVPDAVAAVDAGADAIGLNFFRSSPRNVDLDAAPRISATAMAGGAVPIGLFVNHSPDDAEMLAKLTGIRGWQLHGDENPKRYAEIIARCSSLFSFEDRPSTMSIRVRRFDDRGVAGIVEDLAACRTAGSCPDAVLVDALSPGRYGGTGETVSWLGLADHKGWLGNTPLILAGGLTPDNVAEAIRIVRPAAVDVASGVESAPGKKDPIKVRDFIQAARAAFGE